MKLQTKDKLVFAVQLITAFIVMTLVLLLIGKAQSAPVLTLTDNKLHDRHFIYYANGDYRFTDGIGGAVFSGNIKDQAAGCPVKLNAVTPTHSLEARADQCEQTGIVVINRFVSGAVIPHVLTDTIIDKKEK